LPSGGEGGLMPVSGTGSNAGRIANDPLGHLTTAIAQRLVELNFLSTVIAFVAGMGINSDLFGID